MKCGARIFTIAALLLATTGSEASAGSGQYLPYEQFKQFAALCPEVKNARLAGMTQAADELWSKNELRLPAETHLLEADFNGDGKLDSALVLTDGAQCYLVIADNTDGGWRRIGFVRIAREDVGSWNGEAICLGENDFVAWNGNKFRLEHGPLAIYSYSYEVPEFRSVMIKLTYVGEQTKPVPGFLLTSYYRLPDLEEFKKRRAKNIFYGNDDARLLWHLTLSPGDLHEMVTVLRKSELIAPAEDRKGTEAKVTHSLSLLDTGSAHRPNFCQLFLTADEVKSLLPSFAQTIEKHDENGAKVLREYVECF